MAYWIRHHDYLDNDDRHHHHTGDDHQSIRNHHHHQYKKDPMIDASEHTCSTSRSSLSGSSSSRSSSRSTNSSNSSSSSYSKRPHIEHHYHPTLSLHSSYESPQPSNNNMNVNHPVISVEETADKGLLGGAAVYIKTGNALYNDIEYYEYTIPKSSAAAILYRPPRTPQSIRKMKKQQHEMSEFAQSAYMMAATSPREYI